MTTRHILEWESRSEAGSIEQVGDYHWVKVLNRFHMYVLDSDKSVSPHLIKDGFWESWITTWVTNNVDDTTCFIDVGANTGYYSFLAAHLRAVAIAYEPNPTYYDMMNSTIARTHSKGVFPQPVALSDYTGEATLNIPLELHGSASLNEILPQYPTTKVEVMVRPLDEIMRVESSNYIQKHVVKIDAEGEEERILRGAKQFITDSKDITILLEYTPGAYSSRFVGELFENYDVSAINHDGGDELVLPQWIESQTDWVMLVLRPKS